MPVQTSICCPHETDVLVALLLIARRKGEGGKGEGGKGEGGKGEGGKGGGPAIQWGRVKRALACCSPALLACASSSLGPWTLASSTKEDGGKTEVPIYVCMYIGATYCIYVHN